MTTATRAEPAGVYHRRRLEPVDRYRVPSGYPRCRAKRCHQPPAADMNRGPHPRTGKLLWYAYCADHLAGYNREVVDGRVWWRGAQVGAEYACGNCQQRIRLGPAPEDEGGPYLDHLVLRLGAGGVDDRCRLTLLPSDSGSTFAKGRTAGLGKVP